MFAQDDPLSDRTPAVTLDFTTQANWNIPTSGTNTAEGTFTDGTYSIKLAAATNYKLNNGYLILGKTDSYLELPAFSFDVDYITVEGTSGASADVKQNIFVGETAVSTETTGAKNVTNKYAIASAYQAAGNVYTLKITSNHNTQISKINIYKKVSADDVNQPVITPATGVYTEAQEVSMTCSTTGATIYYTTDGTDPSANNGTEYTESFTVSTTTTVKAIAIKGGKSSNISESVITIPAKPALPWSEDWSEYSANDKPSTNNPYYSEDSGGNTKIYTGSMSAGGEEPELLVAKSTGSFTITEIDLSSLGGETATLALLYNTNSKSLAVTTTTENVTIGDAINTTDKTYKRNIIIPAGTTTLNLTFSNSTSSNARLDNLSLVISSAPKEPTFSPAAGTYYGIQQVTVSSATEGATIKVKQSEDGEFETKNSEVTITESKTIWAYAEKDGEKSETVSATYVIGTTETSIAPIITAAEAAGKDGKPVKYTYTPTPINVEYVNGNIAYLHDGTNGIMARSSSNFTWTTGSTIKGYLTGNAELYNGTPSIYVSAIEDETTGSYEPAPTTIEVGQIADNVNKYIKIEGATFVGADSQNNKNLTFKVNDTEFIAYNKFTLDTSNLVADKAYDLVGFGVKFVSGSNAPVYEIYPTAISEKEEQTTYPITVNWDWQNENPASISSVNIQGTTGTVESDVEGYVLTVDATVENGKLAAGSNSTGKYAQFNNGTIIKVPVGSTKDKVTVISYPGQFKYTVGGTAATANETEYSVTASDVTQGFVEIVATGGAYIFSIKAVLEEPEQGGDEPAATDVTATWDFKNVNPSTLSTLSIQKDQTGTVASNVEGIELYVIANAGKLQQRSSDAQFNNGTVIQVPVKNKGDQVVVVSYPNYHHYTIGGINAAADTETYEAKQSDATKGYVEIVSTGTAYLYSITVTQYAPKEATTLDNESATATFPFNLGTAGQTATFTNADYWLNSKVSWGSNFTVNGTRNVSDFTETQLKTTAKEAAAAESNLIKFTITPKPGFTFTPTKVTFTATRVGTDGGKLDVAWYNSNKTSASLETGFTPNRENNAAQPYSTKTYDLTTNTDVVAGEGECGLQFNLYNLDAGKNYGFVNIIIEGTLSGTEKELPILASFKANGTEYTVDEVFGDLYEADLELSKSESMISESNPLTEITATSGEVGTVTYTDATETGCKVTIPVTAGETTLEYILNITQKPDFTLTYIDVDGTTVLKTQTVEKDATIGTFAQDIADVTASKDGYKARGWFKNNYVGEKWATTDVVTADAKLYAVETEIEVSSDSKKYVFDLTDKFFDPADHEAFNPTGGKPNVSDMRHGWAFANGNTIDLLVGPKASIIISTCQYPTNGTTKITASNGQSIDAVSATDGATATIEYEGEAGTLTLSFDGSAYIHKLTILNTAETNYEKDGNWIIAKAGDASSFLDAIDAANGTSGEDPVYIFLPNGTYDLAQTTKTNIGRSNVSIIGESMEGVIIKNRPVKEGIAITATLQNNSENLYMQDLTLDCVAPYGTGDDTNSAERGVTLQDQGTKTICKNVYLKGLQDTYYCNNNNGQYYFEDGKIEGTVDYICGHGDAYFNKVALFNAKRTNGNSGDVIAAPNTPKQYGYIFNECTIDGVDGQDGQYALGRPWASNTQVIFLNTKMKIQPKAEGWSEWNNDVAKQNSVKQFAEYNSVDANGNAIDLTSRKTSFKGVANVPTLNETQAQAFALETVFEGWNPAQYTEQVKTTSAKLNGNTLTWSAVDGATMYAIVKNGSIIDLTDQTSYTIADEAQGAKGLGTATDDPTAAGDTYAVRAANGRGGFGEAVVADDATGIDNITTDATGINGTITEVYSMGGARLAAPQKGVNIVKVKANDGSVKTVKVVIK